MAQHRKRLLSLIVLPLILVAGVGYYILEIVGLQDQELEAERKRFVLAVINNETNGTKEKAHEYTFWKDAIQQVVHHNNRQWAFENIASYLTENFNYDEVIFLTPENQIHMQFGSSPPRDLTEELDLQLIALSDDARSSPQKDYHGLSDWVRLDGELYLAGAGAFTYPSSAKRQDTKRPLDEQYTLLILKKTDQNYWNTLRDKFNLPGLSLETGENNSIKIQLTDRFDRVVAPLAMEGRAGVLTSIFTQYGIGIVFVVILLAGIAVLSVKRTIDYKLAHDELVSMNIRMDELVRQRTEELESALSEMEAASRAKTVFLSSMSHEFRTPLNGILGFAQLLNLQKDENLTEKQQGWLNQISKAGELLLVLVNDVLDMARVESGKISLDPSFIQPRDAFKHCYEIASPLAKQRNITLKSIRKSDNFICVDKVRLQQILLNLMNNAIKYNVDGGEIVFGCYDLDDTYLRLFVRDTGPGIPEAEQAKIFEPFYRIENSTNGTEGTGVGLTLVKRLTNAMDGRISLESKEGEGTTFFVDFPIAGSQDLSLEK